MNDGNNGRSTSPEPFENQFSTAEFKAQNLNEAKMDMSVPEEDSETTIRRVLSAYDVGGKLRQLRMRKKIALVDLGKHTGLSASMLSQLENGRLIPTLPTLARIAMVFDVSLDYFFEKKSKRPFTVVKAADRIHFPERPDLAKPAFFFECLDYSAPDKATQAYLAEFPKRNPGEQHEHYHEGSEFVFVLDGVLTISYASEEHTLRAGDSVYFDASEPHSYRGVSKTPARALVVTAPPRL